ncbi:hypothetical protein QYZ88_003355 [Lachnospiraceae bacterium C1.1]|nr:hypothetical protein [Lachnospiraceae bacterium C1.1]
MKQIFVLLAFLLATTYTDFATSGFRFIPDFLFLIATKDVDFKEVIRKIYRISAVLLLVHLIMYGFFWVFNRSIIQFSARMEANGTLTIRHRIFLSHANTASMIVLWTILGYLYAEYDNLNKKKILCAWGSYVFIHLLTDSNSGLYILTIVSILLLLKNIWGNAIDNAIDFMARYLYIILAIIFNIMMVIFTQLSGLAREIWMNINIFFTGRPLFGAYAYDHYGYSLLGQLIFNKKDFWQGIWIDFAPCDNAYMWIPVAYGVVYLIAIAYLFWKYAGYANFAEKIFIIAYSLYTMMEIYVLYFNFAFSMMIIMRYVWKGKAIDDAVIEEKNGRTETN